MAATFPRSTWYGDHACRRGIGILRVMWPDRLEAYPTLRRVWIQYEFDSRYEGSLRMTAEDGLDNPQNEQDGRPLTVGPDDSAQPGSVVPVWIWDAGRDLVLFVFAPLLIWGAAAVLQRRVDMALLYLGTVTFLAVGHHLPSFVRVCGNREAFGRYRMRLYFAPLVLLAASAAYVHLGLEALTVVLLLWGIWHAMTQTYGIMRIYDSKVHSFAASTIWLDYLTSASWFGAGVLFSSHRMEQLLTAFYACGVPLVSPVVVPATQLLWGGLTVVATTAFVVNYIVQRRQNQRPGLMKLAAMVSNIGFWWFAMVNVQDLLLGILLYEAFHAIQSLALVRVTMLRTVASGSVARWAAVFGRRSLAAGLLMLAAAIVYGLPFYFAKATPFGMAEGSAADLVHRVFYALVATSTMLHFYLEGFTWRLREAWVRSSLGVPALPVAAARAPRLGMSVSQAATWVLLILSFALLGVTQQRRGPTVEGVLANLAEAIPQSWSTRAKYGTWLLSQGRINDAEEELEAARAIRPQSAELLCKLGIALLAQQKVGDAIERLLEAAECDPQSALAQLCLGKALVEDGRVNDGLEHLRSAVTLAPMEAKYHYELGLAQATIDDPDSTDDDDETIQKALASFERAIELNSSFAEAYNARGMVHMAMTEFDAAAADFDQAIQLDPELYKAYRNLALLWDRRKEPEQVIAALTALIAVNPTSSHYVMRGNVYFGLKQFDKARDDYLEGTRQSSQDVEPVKRLVDLYLNESYRDPALAIEYAQMACVQTNWRDFRALALLAASCAAAGNPDQAVRWQEQALQMVPPDVPEHIKLDLRKQLEQYRGNESTTPTPGAAEGSQGPAAPKKPAGMPN